MKWEQLTNQEKIRYANQKKILGIMRFGTHSCTDLSKQTGLSNTAVENIVDELASLDLLRVANLPTLSTRGRKPIGYHLNANYGVVASVDLSGRDLLVCIANTSRQILYRGKVEGVLQITQEVLESVADKIKEGLKTERVKGKQLLCISIASPGKIDQETGYFLLAPRIENYREVNLKTFFSSRFDCEVIVKRDMQCGLIGERQFGVLADEKCQNALFLHFDILLSSAIMLGGQVYGGDHGYSGEMGFMSPDITQPNAGMDDKLSLTSMCVRLKQKVKDEPNHPLQGKYVLSFDEVKALFLNGDKTVDEVAKETAGHLAVHLLNVANLLDVWQVVIEGRVIELGETFLQYVNEYVKKYNRSGEKFEVRYSGLMNKAITLGCIHAGVEAQFDKVLLSRANG